MDKMYVVIAGGGKVGRAIAAELLQEGHGVAVIERVEGRCEQLLMEHDLLVIHGDACDVRYLEQAKVDRADVFAATTRSDEENFVACRLALTSFAKVPRAIARVNAPANEELFEQLGIEPVSTTRLISRLIHEEVTVEDLVRLHTIQGGRLDVVEVAFAHDKQPPADELGDLALPESVVPLCLIRGVDEEVILPDDQVGLQPGDRLVALTTPELEGELRAAVRRPRRPR